MANQQDNICPICKQPMGDPHEHEDTHRSISTTKCHRPHTFGRTCLQRWLEQVDNCPLCRQPEPLGRENLRAEGTTETAGTIPDDGQPPNATLFEAPTPPFLYNINGVIWTQVYSTALPHASNEALRFLQRAQDRFAAHVRLLRPPIAVPSPRNIENAPSHWDDELWHNYPDWHRSRRGEVFQRALSLYFSRISEWETTERGPLCMEVYRFLNSVEQHPGWYLRRDIYHASALLEASHEIRRYLTVEASSRPHRPQTNPQARHPQEAHTSTVTPAYIGPRLRSTASTRSAPGPAGPASVRLQNSTGQSPRPDHGHEAAFRSIQRSQKLRERLERDRQTVRRDSIALARGRLERASLKEREREREEQKRHEEPRKREERKAREEPTEQKKRKAQGEQKQPKKEKEQKQCRDQMGQEKQRVEGERNPKERKQEIQQTQRQQHDEVCSKPDEHEEIFVMDDVEIQQDQQHEEPLQDEDTEMPDADQDYAEDDLEEGEGIHYPGHPSPSDPQADDRT